MSVFRVNLRQNGALGTLDSVNSSGYSVQRTLFADGPNGISRKLTDGTTFTDCNYWKKFTTNSGADPSVCFLDLVTDDGSLWIPGTTSTFPYVWTLSITGGSTYATKKVNITGTGDANDDTTGATPAHGASGYATYLQITNSHASQSVQVRLNGSSTSVFTLEGNSVQTFQLGDLSISKVEFAAAGSASPTVAVEVLASIISAVNS